MNPASCSLSPLALPFSWAHLKGDGDNGPGERARHGRVACRPVRPKQPPLCHRIKECGGVQAG